MGVQFRSCGDDRPCDICVICLDCNSEETICPSISNIDVRSSIKQFVHNIQPTAFDWLKEVKTGCSPTRLYDIANNVDISRRRRRRECIESAATRLVHISARSDKSPDQFTMPTRCRDA